MCMVGLYDGSLSDSKAAALSWSTGLSSEDAASLKRPPANPV